MLPADVQAGLCLCCSQIPEEGFLKSRPILWTFVGERSGSVVECLTWDRGEAGSSLTGVTAL